MHFSRKTTWYRTGYYDTETPYDAPVYFLYRKFDRPPLPAILCLLAAWTVAVAAHAEQPPPWFSPEPGPHVVVTIDNHAFPRESAKPIPARVYYPDDDGPFPLILASHGAGANKDMSPAMMAYWASHGYVVVTPTHQQELGGGTGLFRAVREFVQRSRLGGEKWRSRVDELRTIIDAAEAGQGWPPHVAARIDASKIGLMGHSFGAYTALLMAGALLFEDDHQTFDYRDARIDAAVVISGPGRDDYGLTATSFHTLDGPLLVFAGSNDPGGPGEGGPRWRAEPYRFAPDGDKYLAFVEGATHVSYMGGLARVAGGQGPFDTVRDWFGIKNEDGRTARIYGATQVLCRAFWDAYLASDQSALNRLRTMDSNDLDFVEWSAK